jgi:GT2 family glycosyltransferase
MASSRRPSASIVIPVWNGWDLTRACLETLRPTLGVRDDVIVVDNGSEDATPDGLRGYPWAKIITNPENRGFAAACNQGAIAATRDVVVFLNNDTLLSGRWLDALLAPFADASVGATGPRSNFVSGPQEVVDPPYLQGRTQDLRRFVKEWAASHKGQTTEVPRLVGFCLAVSTALFDELGGFDEGFGIGGFEDDDLCARIRAGGRRLMIAHESFVHHHGHATFDINGLDWHGIQGSNEDRFVSKHGVKRGAKRNRSKLLAAALIVKDEERLLPACLDSLQGLVDECHPRDRPGRRRQGHRGVLGRRLRPGPKRRAGGVQRRLGPLRRRRRGRRDQRQAHAQAHRVGDRRRRRHRDREPGR